MNMTSKLKTKTKPIKHSTLPNFFPHNNNTADPFVEDEFSFSSLPLAFVDETSLPEIRPLTLNFDFSSLSEEWVTLDPSAINLDPISLSPKLPKQPLKFIKNQVAAFFTSFDTINSTLNLSLHSYSPTIQLDKYGKPLFTSSNYRGRRKSQAPQEIWYKNASKLFSMLQPQPYSDLIAQNPFLITLENHFPNPKPSLSVPSSPFEFSVSELLHYSLLTNSNPDIDGQSESDSDNEEDGPSDSKYQDETSIQIAFQEPDFILSSSLLVDLLFISLVPSYETKIIAQKFGGSTIILESLSTNPYFISKHAHFQPLIDYTQVESSRFLHQSTNTPVSPKTGSPPNKRRKTNETATNDSSTESTSNAFNYWKAVTNVQNRRHPSRSFNHVIKWHAGKFSLIIGSDLQIFSLRDCGIVSSFLFDRSDLPLSPHTCFSMWISSIMANVSHTLLCIHNDGVVLRYLLIPVSHIPLLCNFQKPDDKFPTLDTKQNIPFLFEPKTIHYLITNAFSWLNIHCRDNFSTWILSKDSNSQNVHLYQIGKLVNSKTSSTAWSSRQLFGTTTNNQSLLQQQQQQQSQATLADTESESESVKPMLSSLTINSPQIPNKNRGIVSSGDSPSIFGSIKDHKTVSKSVPLFSRKFGEYLSIPLASMAFRAAITRLESCSYYLYSSLSLNVAKACKNMPINPLFSETQSNLDRGPYSDYILSSFRSSTVTQTQHGGGHHKSRKHSQLATPHEKTSLDLSNPQNLHSFTTSQLVQNQTDKDSKMVPHLIHSAYEYLLYALNLLDWKKNAYFMALIHSLIGDILISTYSSKFSQFRNPTQNLALDPSNLKRHKIMIGAFHHYCSSLDLYIAATKFLAPKKTNTTTDSGSLNLNSLKQRIELCKFKISGILLDIARFFVNVPNGESLAKSLILLQLGYSLVSELLEKYIGNYGDPEDNIPTPTTTTTTTTTPNDPTETSWSPNTSSTLPLFDTDPLASELPLHYLFSFAGNLYEYVSDFYYKIHSQSQETLDSASIFYNSALIANRMIRSKFALGYTAVFHAYAPVFDPHSTVKISDISNSFDSFIASLTDSLASSYSNSFSPVITSVHNKYLSDWKKVKTSKSNFPPSDWKYLPPSLNLCHFDATRDVIVLPQGAAEGNSPLSQNFILTSYYLLCESLSFHKQAMGLISSVDYIHPYTLPAQRKIAYILNELGQQSLTNGRITKAIGQFNLALDYFKSSGDLENLALVYLNLGKTFAKQTDKYQLALNHFEQALKIMPESSPYRSLIWTNMGDILATLGLKAQDPKFFYQSIEHYKNGHADHKLPSVRWHLGFTLSSSFRSFVKTALKFSVDGETLSTSSSSESVANLLTTDKTSKALELFKSACQALESVLPHFLTPNTFKHGIDALLELVDVHIYHLKLRSKLPKYFPGGMSVSLYNNLESVASHFFSPKFTSLLSITPISIVDSVQTIKPVLSQLIKEMLMILVSLAKNSMHFGKGKSKKRVYQPFLKQNLKLIYSTLLRYKSSSGDAENNNTLFANILVKLAAIFAAKK